MNLDRNTLRQVRAALVAAREELEILYGLVGELQRVSDCESEMLALIDGAKRKLDQAEREMQ